MPTNVLLITSDQQHHLALGARTPRLKTPNLDRLAAGGVTFGRAYCPNPTCTPTRASILTGLWPSAHGAYTLGTKLPEHLPTVGGHLRRAGYQTSLIGKAHFEPLRSAEGVDSRESYPRLRDLDYWRTFDERHAPWYGFGHVELARNHADEGHAGQHYALWLEDKGLADWRAYFQPRTDGVRDTDHDAAKAAGHRRLGAPLQLRDPTSWALPAELHYTTWTAERTNAQIDAAADAGRPFFCWSSYHDPHPPYLVPEPWAGMYDPDDMEALFGGLLGEFEPGEFDDMSPLHRLTRDPAGDFAGFDPDGMGSHGVGPHWVEGETMTRADLRRAAAAYCGMVSFMDHALGTTLDRLDARGLTGDTLVVFTSDHGHFLGQHGLVAKGPFHYEDLIRVPLIARLPGRLPAGAANDAPQTLVDLPATFLEAAGLGTPHDMQARPMLDAWTNGGGRAAVVVENHHNGAAVHLRTLVTDRHKLTLWRGRDNAAGWGELFDLAADPGERRNLYADPAHADLRADLMARFLQAELDREPTLCRRVSGA